MAAIIGCWAPGEYNLTLQKGGYIRGYIGDYSG